MYSCLTLTNNTVSCIRNKEFINIKQRDKRQDVGDDDDNDGDDDDVQG